MSDAGQSADQRSAALQDTAMLLEQRPAGSPSRIVIVGGGAGGLELAAKLGDSLGKRSGADVPDILLVDQQPVHLWKPLLHEVAAGTLSGDEGGLDFLQQARRHGFRFHIGRMTALERTSRLLTLAPLLDEAGRELVPARQLAYDTLVLAVGSLDNDFGIPGVRDFAISLNHAHDAERLHRRLIDLLARAEILDLGPVHVVIVGGGATGVELAAELSEASRELGAYGKRAPHASRNIAIHVIESGPRLLGAQPEFLARKAERWLVERGIEVLTGRRVSEVRDGAVITSGQSEEHIPADITVWAAGIRAPDWLADLDGLETNRQGQLVVGPTLQTTRDSRIFAIGDCAACDINDAKVPPTAQAAHQQARLLARSLAGQYDGAPLLSFSFSDRGSLIALGQRSAIGDLVEEPHGRIVELKGVAARISYWLLYRRHLAALQGVRRAAFAVLGSWLSERAQPRVKLH